MMLKLIGLVTCAYLCGPVQAPATATPTTVLTLTMPTAESEPEIEGIAIRGTGVSRTFETPPLAADRPYQYTVTVRWAPNTYTNMTRTKAVGFHAVDRLTSDLSADDPSDRVSVLYVPTPDHVV